jgi:hypothetical protein
MDSLPDDIVRLIYDYLPFINKVTLARAYARAYRLTDQATRRFAYLGDRKYRDVAVVGDVVLDVLFGQSLALTLDIVCTSEHIVRLSPEGCRHAIYMAEAFTRHTFGDITLYEVSRKNKDNLLTHFGQAEVRDGRLYVLDLRATLREQLRYCGSTARPARLKVAPAAKVEPLAGLKKIGGLYYLE